MERKGFIARLFSCFTSGLLFNNTKPSNAVLRGDYKSGYVLINLLFSGVLLYIIYFGSALLKFSAKTIDCPEDARRETCISVNLTYRASFAFTFFHLLLLLVCCRRDKLAKSVNEGFWIFKFIALAGIFGATFALPSNYFHSYAFFSYYLSCFYLFCQMISLIDFFYLLAEFFMKKVENGRNSFSSALFFIGLIFYGASAYLCYEIIEMFWISTSDSCGLNKTLLVLVLFACGASASLLLLKVAQHGSLATSGGITLFSLFTLWSSFLSYPNATCNPLLTSSTGMLLQIIGSSLFGFIVSFYFSWVSQGSRGMRAAGIDNINYEIIRRRTGATDTTNGADYQRFESQFLEKIEDMKSRVVDYQKNSFIKFHIYMVFFAIYMSPVYSNWGFAHVWGQESWSFSNDDWEPFMVKALIAVASPIFYTWSIVAPKFKKAAGGP